MMSTPGRMKHQKRFFRLLLSAIIFFLFYSSANPDQPLHRFDLIQIHIPDPPHAYEMPAVTFLHDRHTQALGQNNCQKCHLKKETRFCFQFMRTETLGYFKEKDLYHAQCIGCHRQFHAQGKKSGPRTGQCRLCHVKSPVYLDYSQTFDMDKSLHYRHITAEAVAPESGYDRKADGNCSACHHEYDKTLQKTIYVKGKEGTCRYCHRSAKTETTRAFKTVAHEACINCHIRLAAPDIKAGPVECAGCHDPIHQAKIAKLEDVARLKMNQPDVALLSLWVKEARESQNPSFLFVMPVAFNHAAHEKKVDRCRSCHHETMGPCHACHTRTGNEKGNFIILEQAMHDRESAISCMGCHRLQTLSKDCAGCHRQINPRQKETSTCATCHIVSKQMLDPLPANPEICAQIAREFLDRRSKPCRAPEDQIPEKVMISVMSDQYEGVLMPHRRIILELFQRTEKSGLTSVFHNEPTTLCRGCHHYSPSSQAFPKCASCHGLLAQNDPSGKPGLLGAYHGQCIACHQYMELEKPLATDCTSCHAKREAKTVSSPKMMFGR